jgi:hypothetical protein
MSVCADSLLRAHRTGHEALCASLGRPSLVGLHPESRSSSSIRNAQLPAASVLVHMYTDNATLVWFGGAGGSLGQPGARIGPAPYDRYPLRPRTEAAAAAPPRKGKGISASRSHARLPGLVNSPRPTPTAAGWVGRLGVVNACLLQAEAARGHISNVHSPQRRRPDLTGCKRGRCGGRGAA